LGGPGKRALLGNRRTFEGAADPCPEFMPIRHQVTDKLCIGRNTRSGALWNPDLIVKEERMKPHYFMLMAALGLASAPIESEAQIWTTRPRRVISAYGAASTIDIIPRVLSQQLSPQLGQNIVVENRVGAG